MKYFKSVCFNLNIYDLQKKKNQYLKIVEYCGKVQFSLSESEYSSHTVLRRAQVAMMGKTTDLIVVQETLIDTFHKEAKPQKVIS